MGFLRNPKLLFSRRWSFNYTLWNVACPYLFSQNSGQGFLSSFIPTFELLSQIWVDFYIKCLTELVSVQSCIRRIICLAHRVNLGTGSWWTAGKKGILNLIWTHEKNLVIEIKWKNPTQCWLLCCMQWSFCFYFNCFNLVVAAVCATLFLLTASGRHVYYGGVFWKL